MIKGRRRIVTIAVASAMVIVGGVLGTAAAANANSVLGGITVGGIPVSGLEEARVLGKLGPAAHAIETRELDLIVGERSWKMSPRQFGIRIDLGATTKAAMIEGRRNPFRLLLHSIGAAKAEVPWQARVDNRRFASAIRNLADEVKIEASNGDVLISGHDVTIKPPSVGTSLLVGPLRKQLIAAALHPKNSDKLPLPVTISPPMIGSDEVARVGDQARQLLSGPAEFLFGSKTLSLPPERIAAALRVRAVSDSEAPDGSESLLLQADPDELRTQIEQAFPEVAKPPRDASYSVDGNNVKLVPSTEGSTVDTAAAATAIMNLRTGPREPIQLPVRSLPASFNTERASSLAIVTRISSFTTTFDPRNAPRVANIDRMASAIDGKIVRPGDLFSLNAATGPRTAENGYQQAKVIVDGELVPGLGGGVCQVATTTFNAAFMAGLDIKERTNHSLYISHYPLGRDATVDYGHLDLRFVNDTSFGLLLKATSTAKSLNISIYSSPLGRKVEFTTSSKTDPVPQTNKYVDDPTLPAGQEVVSEEGSPGFRVTVVRTVKSGDQVLHSDKFLSKYQPWKRIIRRGTGPAAPASPSPS